MKCHKLVVYKLYYGMFAELENICHRALCIVYYISLNVNKNYLNYLVSRCLAFLAVSAVISKKGWLFLD